MWAREGSVNPLQKIDLPIQSVIIIVIITIILSGLCCFFHLNISDLILHFISKFLFHDSCVSVRHSAGILLTNTVES